MHLSSGSGIQNVNTLQSPTGQHTFQDMPWLGLFQVFFRAKLQFADGSMFCLTSSIHYNVNKYMSSVYKSAFQVLLNKFFHWQYRFIKVALHIGNRLSYFETNKRNRVFIDRKIKVPQFLCCDYMCMYL